MAPTIGSRALRVYAVLVFLAVAGVCALVCWAFPRQDRLASARDGRLRSVDGEIWSTEIQTWKMRRPSRRIEWEVSVRYTFEVGGREYSGQHLDFSHTSAKFSAETDAARFQSRYPVRKRVTVWYDSADPWDSALDPAWVPVTPYVIPAVAVGTFSFIVAFLLARDTLRWARENPLPPEEIARGLANLRNASAAFAGLAAAVLLVHFLPVLWHHAVVKPRLGTVDTFLTGAPEVRGDPPYPDVQYLFKVEGETELRLGSAWRFGRLGVESEATAEALAARLRDENVARGHVVHFVPGDPSRNALSTDHGGVLSRAPVVASAVVFALGLALAALSSKARRRYPPSRQLTPRARPGPASPARGTSSSRRRGGR